MKWTMILLLVVALATPAFPILDEEDAEKPGENNPLRAIARMMGRVASDLRGKETGIETQK